MNSMEKGKIYDIERWSPRSVGAQYDTEEEQRNSLEKNEEAEPKQKTTPSCGCDVMEAKSDAVKNNIA